MPTIKSMDGMVRYLEDAGFEVKKEYFSSSRRYLFTIKKYQFERSEYFTYPKKDGVDKSKIMKDFCDQLIETFYANLGYARGGPAREAEKEYIRRDVETTLEVIRHVRPGITEVIFNNPATIVFWSDGTKSVVKTQNGEAFDPEKGLAMAIVKKAFGNKGNYYNYIKKWVDEYEANRIPSHFKTKEEAEKILTQMNQIIEDYGHVTVADMLDLVGSTCSYVDNKYGWVNLKDAKIEEAFGGYILVLPRRYPLY